MRIIWEMQNRSKLFLWNYIHQNFDYSRICILWKRAGNALISCSFVTVVLSFELWALSYMLFTKAGVYLLISFWELVSYLNYTDKMGGIAYLLPVILVDYIVGKWWLQYVIIKGMQLHLLAWEPNYLNHIALFYHLHDMHTHILIITGWKISFQSCSYRSHQSYVTWHLCFMLFWRKG